MLVAAVHFFDLVAHEVVDDALVDTEGGNHLKFSLYGIECVEIWRILRFE